MDDILKDIIELINSKKGSNIIVIDIQHISSIAKYIVIVTVNSLTQSNAIANYIIDFYKEKGLEKLILNKNLAFNNPWLLIDASDIIIHLFMKEQREFYSLEKIYAKGNIIYTENLLKNRAF